ncbi:ABC transporter ATP-binding protein [Brevibacterium sp. BRM-1]|uniref:ABC transporter ATP-binding protein n=1 Tax=Brevibacterium sp. BRM-1 TaxID=2999062 RepID=UPI00227F3ECF|nr:ABC transporter ATP-binding protein [Brevibacterium sp. BRM-1]WAL39635.1 ABC transporter ATP-binding protein [Brevibacterium sp. BRM-1]
MSTEPLLEVSHLTVDITSAQGPRRILDDISLSIAPGEPMGLVGESGSGKSMTLRTILGMLPHGARVVSGEVRYAGHDILTAGVGRGYRSSVRGAGISMVFQEPAIALNPVMRVGQQITDAVAERKRLSRRAAADLAVELLERVGIPDPGRRARAYPFELSGGMRQRVMIAAALAQEPNVLLCDEPTTALDVTIQAQVLDLFRSMQQERGLGLLYVTHDLAVVAQLCTALSVMQGGRIVEQGGLQAIFDDPQHAYTQRLLRSTPRLPAGPLDAVVAQ